MVISSQFIFFFALSLLLSLAVTFADSHACQSSLGHTGAKYLKHLLVFFVLLAIVGMGISNFQVMLTLLTGITTLIVIIDRLFFHKKRIKRNEKRGFIVKNAYDFFGVLLLVWVIRSFLIQYGL